MSFSMHRELSFVLEELRLHFQPSHLSTLPTLSRFPKSYEMDVQFEKKTCCALASHFKAIENQEDSNLIKKKNQRFKEINSDSWLEYRGELLGKLFVACLKNPWPYGCNFCLDTCMLIPLRGASLMIWCSLDYDKYVLNPESQCWIPCNGPNFKKRKNKEEILGKWFSRQIPIFRVQVACLRVLKEETLPDHMKEESSNDEKEVAKVHFVQWGSAIHYFKVPRHRHCRKRPRLIESFMRGVVMDKLDLNMLVRTAFGRFWKSPLYSKSYAGKMCSLIEMIQRRTACRDVRGFRLSN